MGQSPAGLNATGESDTRFYYNHVRAEQEALKIKIVQLKILVAKADAKIDIEFPEL